MASMGILVLNTLYTILAYIYIYIYEYTYMHYYIIYCLNTIRVLTDKPGGAPAAGAASDGNIVNIDLKCVLRSRANIVPISFE